MKKTIWTVVAALMALSFLAGCQKTPESSIIIGKDIDNMIDKALASPVVAAEAPSGSPSASAGSEGIPAPASTGSEAALRKALNAPDRMTLDTQGAKGNLKIHVDADVVVPNAASMPVARVARREFSEENVKNLYNALSGGAKSISADSMPAGIFYLEQIQQLQQLKDSGGNDKMSPADIDKQIQQLTTQAATAPDNYQQADPDFSFKSNQDETKYLPSGTFAHLCFTPDGKTVSEIYVIQDSDGTGSYAQYIRDKYGEESSMGGGTDEVFMPSISQDDAQKIAQDTITKMGLAGFVCTGKREGSASTEVMQISSFGPTGGVGSNKGLYEFMYTRSINNVPVTFTDDEGLTTVHDAYFAPWMYERITIFVDDKGVFFLRWNSPYNVKEIVSDKSSMKPFTDIEAIFKKMTPIKYDWMDDDDRFSVEMDIKEVRLGLMRITEKDVGDSGLLIPVWDFFGTRINKDKTGEYPIDFTYNSFITINAIDGSIIDREIGY